MSIQCRKKGLSEGGGLCREDIERRGRGGYGKIERGNVRLCGWSDGSTRMEQVGGWPMVMKERG